jgi:2-methylcitrate dehydratase PrpD
MNRITGTAIKPLARRLAAQCLGPVPVAENIEKLRLCLLDFFACAFESRNLPWVRQVGLLAEQSVGPATRIAGNSRLAVAEAAFANAVAGHGLVREDMHAGSVSHLGIVVLPTLLALAQRVKAKGANFAAAAIVGYEVGGRVGRTLVTPTFARTFRPTAFTGPIAGAVAGARLLGLDEAATASAIVLAANSAAGLNEWPHTGADEMLIQAGNAARNAITSVELAELGIRASERGLDGEAGLFAAYRPDRPAPELWLFPDGKAEIAEVYFKPLPVCNFAQTPCLAALALAKNADLNLQAIASIRVLVTEAALRYPGCNWAGPFERVLQAKMSIQFAVAAALMRQKVDEQTYERLDEAGLMRLTRKISVESTDELTAAFPAKQGAIVEVTLTDGRRFKARLDDVIPPTPTEMRERYRIRATDAIGRETMAQLEEAIERLEWLDDVGVLAALSVAPARQSES